MLFLTSTSDKVQVITTATGAATADVHASWVDLSAGVVTAGRTNTKISTATTTDVVASPAASTTRNIKTLVVGNNHASLPNTVTLQHTDGTNVIILENVTLQPGEAIKYHEATGLHILDVNGIPKSNYVVPVGQYAVQRLSADLANSTVTAAKVTGLDLLCGVGTWIFEYYIYYTTVITTTGIKLGVNHTGTVAPFMYNMHTSTALSTAADGNADQDILTATGGLYNVWAARAKTTSAPIITAGVDTNAADMLALIYGMCIVTASGNLELYSASEVAASSTSVKAGSALRLTKVG